MIINIADFDCFECGCNDGWRDDGRGRYLCDCQACPDCYCVDGHYAGCAELAACEEAEEMAAAATA